MHLCTYTYETCINSLYIACPCISAGSVFLLLLIWKLKNIVLSFHSIANPWSKYIDSQIDLKKHLTRLLEIHWTYPSSCHGDLPFNWKDKAVAEASCLKAGGFICLVELAVQQFVTVFQVVNQPSTFGVGNKRSGQSNYKLARNLNCKF